MTNYYVSPDGTNTWPYCTSSENPCPASSANKEFLGARAGDIVYFLPGTYDPGNAPSYEVPAWNPSNSGSDGSPIIFKSYSGTCTILHNNSGPAIGSYGKSYITWDGFTGTRTSLFNFVRLDNGANHCTIQNCGLTGWDSGGLGGNLTTLFVQSSTDPTIRNNKLHGNTGSSANNTAMTFYSVSDATVENNDIYDNTTGIHDKDGGQYNTYRYNWIYNNSSSGFRVSTEAGGPNPNHIYAYQNVFRNPTLANIWLGGSKSHSYYYIYNNTIYSNSEEGIYVGDGTGWNTVEIFNNIIYTGLRGFNYISGITNFISNYNCIYNVTTTGRLGSTDYTTLANWQGTSLDVNSVSGNPNFVNAGGRFVTDYRRTSYPTNGRGGSYPNVMGAYITGSEQIGYLEDTGSASPSHTPSHTPSHSRSKSMSKSQSPSLSASPSAGYDYTRFIIHSSSNIIDGEITTHQLVPPGVKQYEDFQDGVLHDVSNPADSINLNSDKYTEIEWCLQATDEAEVGETYEFRVTKGVPILM